LNQFNSIGQELKIAEKKREIVRVNHFLSCRKRKGGSCNYKMVRLINVGHVVLGSQRWRAATSGVGEKAMECIPVEICKEFRYFLFHERATHGQRQPSRSEQARSAPIHPRSRTSPYPHQALKMVRRLSFTPLYAGLS
jgi:hypothetical protein